MLRLILWFQEAHLHCGVKRKQSVSITLRLLFLVRHISTWLFYLYRGAGYFQVAAPHKQVLSVTPSCRRLLLRALRLHITVSRALRAHVVVSSARTDIGTTKSGVMECQAARS